jgi:protoporphyrinogen oxidase
VEFFIEKIFVISLREKYRVSKKTAIIIGAGPAGLTAAMELLEKTDIVPVVYEASNQIGGIAKTVNYKGNRIDIGGHRFFSKSDWVMDWWTKIMPIQGAPSKDELTLRVSYQNKSRDISLDANGPDPEKTDLVMLVRQRLSRIFYLRKFFDYPVSLNMATIRNLGFRRISKIGVSYIKARLFPIKKEKSLEDFFINRFGRELYLTFFKDYTEKVWGQRCEEIDPDWGAQRIKGLSISKAIAHAVKQIVTTRPKGDASVKQKDVETSLIERFLYPKLGPGQMWEEVARRVEERGGKVIMDHRVTGIHVDKDKVVSVQVKDTKTGKTNTAEGNYVFSTMPVRELVAGIDGQVPADVKRVADGLMYRDFMTVGLLLNKLKISNETDRTSVNNVVPDNWIYIQERDVKVGRLQIFNNWSPYMVKDPNTVWVGMEYFVNEGDKLWSMADDKFAKFAIDELVKIDIIDKDQVLDSTVLRVLKAYPAYFGTYKEFDKVRDYLDGFSNLYLIGRNGMHRYNNQDHSMLSAMTAVANIIGNRSDKSNIWEVNAEKEYHESKGNSSASEAGAAAPTASQA